MNKKLFFVISCISFGAICTMDRPHLWIQNEHNLISLKIGDVLLQPKGSNDFGELPFANSLEAKGFLQQFASIQPWDISLNKALDLQPITSIQELLQDNLPPEKPSEYEQYKTQDFVVKINYIPTEKGPLKPDIGHEWALPKPQQVSSIITPTTKEYTQSSKIPELQYEKEHIKSEEPNMFVRAWNTLVYFFTELIPSWFTKGSVSNN